MTKNLDKLILSVENKPVGFPTLHVSKPCVPDLTDATVFLKYLLHVSAIRCAMASWGQPLEAIISAMLLGEPPHKR